MVKENILKIILSLLFFISFSRSDAQFMNYSISTGQSHSILPFEMHNDFIVLPVLLDGKLPLKFILDTGASHSMVIHKEWTDLLGIKYIRKLQIRGVDRAKMVNVLVTEAVDLELPEVMAKNQNLLVLENTEIEFNKYSGIYIDGILGMDLFKKFIVKIDYTSRFIYLFERDKHELNLKKYNSVPISPEEERMYVTDTTSIKNNIRSEVKWLVDSGAALTALLQINESDSLLLPQEKAPGNIGRGLGGFILGYLGRIKEINFGGYQFENVISNFQQIPDSTFFKEHQGIQKGIIGNKILKQFHIIFDYNNRFIHIKPNKDFNKKGNKDLSGMSLIASGSNLNQFSVEEVFPNSPAEKAGVKKGDFIKKINGKLTSLMRLENVEKKLKKGKGGKIKLIIRRENEEKKLKINFMLEEYL